MSEARENRLTEISVDSLLNLREKFKVDWPSHIIAFKLIDNFVTKAPADRKHSKFYSLNDDWERDGTFVSVQYDVNIIFATLNPKHDNLKTALKLFDYSNKKFFMCLRKVYRPVVDEVIKEKELQMHPPGGTKMNFLAKEDAKTFHVEIPPNFKLKQLSRENAFKVNSVWPNKSEGSVVYIEYLIDQNTSVGLYEEESDELAAWCLRMDSGCLSTLQVDEKHRRKGFGEIVTKAISKKIAVEFDSDITANVVYDNFASANLFRKLGFIEIDENHWIEVKKL